MDLISRKELLNALEKEQEIYENNMSSPSFWTALSVVRHMPPVEEKEVVHGEWKKVGSGSLYDTYECTNCHCPPKWDCLGDNHWKISFTDFCPNCGADMRKEV